MIIHVVQKGDTVFSIADQYKVPVKRLIRDNELEGVHELVSGQTIVIAYPLKTYTVQEGDNLYQIAETNKITLKQLLRNNPFLSDREYIYPGESLVISYANNKGILRTNGYANTFINMDILECNLPFLTYITVMGYRTTKPAEISGVNDEVIIRMANEFNVVPTMMLSNFTTEGRSNVEDVFQVLYNEELVDRFIENMINILKRKGYKGVKLTYQYINEVNQHIYENFTQKLVVRLKQEGFFIFVIISENFIVNADRITFEKVDLAQIGDLVDGVALLNYNWGYSFGPPAPVTSVYIMKEFLKYMIQYIPPEKIEIGVPIIGYDWELPYIIGETKANSLTLDSAIALAGDVGSTIQFDDISQTPYFKYTNTSTGIPRQHIVWFIDARSIDAVLGVIKEYGISGVGIWNIMNINPQIWLTINSQFEIETLNC